MAHLDFLIVSPASFSKLPDLASAVLHYEREIPNEDDSEAPDSAPTERIFALPRSLGAQFSVDDYFADSTIGVRVTNTQGVTLAIFDPQTPSISELDEGHVRFHLTWRLSEEDIDAICNGLTPLDPVTTHVLNRQGQFVAVAGGLAPDFREYTLLVGTLRATEIAPDTLKALFGSEEFRTTARKLEPDQLEDLASLQVGEMQSLNLNLQGRFGFTLPIVGDESGWLWLLNGPKLFAGLQEERDLQVRRTVTILLPFPSTNESNGFHSNGTGSSLNATSEATRPLDATEDELLSTPELFNDDPGTFCKPFANPNRVVGERTFHTVLRVTQPEIGGDPSVPPPGSRPTFPFSPDLVQGGMVADPGRTGGGGQPIFRMVTPVGLTSVIAAATSVTNSADGGGALATPALVTTDEAIEQRRRYVLANSSGRRKLSSKTLMDWEIDSSIYQATSLAFGHILEFRVIWRSNGYSLGNVAHTLTLAPRQSRRILTTKSSIVDRVSRREVTQVGDAVNQGTIHEYSYTDAVRSNLSEWSKGGSEASTTGASLGLGFAMKGFVLGGGASHGSASSTSWMNGGRNVAASEEQSLRDAIRQYGESLRKLESMVVVEQSQEEFVQATSEVVRNPNYCHSLTVIYHEILRHMRVDTRVVGARECVFVPLAIQPFTAERTLRWRDILERRLLKPELRWVMRYLEEVVTNFASGEFPSGARADQPVRYLSGSIYIQLAVERPKDADDGAFAESNWNPIIPYSRTPVHQIFARLAAEAEQRRDALFQRDHAPTIAANWVNSLRLSTSTGPLNGVDFTFASKYLYNQTLRVDFTYTPSSPLTRRNLVDLTIEASDPLSKGSVANVKKVEIHYFTDTFDHQEISPSLTDDLITIPEGEPDPNAARMHLALSEWERQDMRAILLGAVQDLITHLNEHIELYHKHIWWEVDRDKLLMLLDSIYVLGPEDGRSVASVVEREPIGIMGNALVYQVAAGAFLGVDGHASPNALNLYYRDTTAASEPIRVSLPTSGLYAQAIIDECSACEEHEGSEEWVLTDKEPELADLGVDALASRRAQLPEATPSQLPASIINLQNAPAAPAPSGLSGALDAVTDANAFRDITGLAGNQANARASMETAANLAAQFAAQAVELRKSEMGTELAKKKMDVIKKAQEKGLADQAEAQRQTQKVLNDMHVNQPSQPDRLTQEPDVSEAIRSGQEVEISRTLPDGTSESVAVNKFGGGLVGVISAPAMPAFPPRFPDPLTKRSELDLAFATALTAVEADPSFASLTNVRDLPFVIVALNSDGTRPYVGQHETKMYFSGSLLKVASMYAAYQLRSVVNDLAATLDVASFPTQDALFKKVSDTFDHEIDNAVHRISTEKGISKQMRVPKYGRIFTAKPDAGHYTVDFRADSSDLKVDFAGHLREMIRDSVDNSAGFCIQMLGYSWINGLMQKAGFFNPANDQGIWLAGDFVLRDGDEEAGDPKASDLGLRQWPTVVIDSENDDKVKQVTTCIDIARLLVLLSDNKLVKDEPSHPDTSNLEMLSMMGSAVSGRAPSRLTAFAAPAFTVQQCKIGVAPLKGGRCLAPISRCVTSEAMIVQDPATTRKFVVVYQNVKDAKVNDFHRITNLIQRILDNYHP